MAGFADTLRGDGLARAQRALAGLEGDPQQLSRARIRFDDSPPPYKSDRSGTTTRSQSPNPPSEEQRRLQERRVQLGLDADASKPYYQFEHQTSDEEKRIFEADLNGTRCLPVGSNPYKMAYENIKKSWVEQGIWNKKWNEMASGRWKHEEPLEVESRSETDLDASISLFVSPQLKPRELNSDEEKQRVAERRAVLEREREASRPYFQFLYQVSKERERIQGELRSEEGGRDSDINSRAYENVKAVWIKRGIWNRKWGILPGMSWKHEEPLEEDTANGPVSALADLRGNAQLPVNYERVEEPSRPIFGSPSLVDQPQESSVVDALQQGSLVNIDLVSLENGDAEHTPSTSNSPRTRTNGQVLRPIIGHGSRRSNRNPSQKAQLMVNDSLGPVHPSKVSKAARKKQLRPQQQPNIPKRVSFGNLSLSSDVDTAEPRPLPTQATLRRSKRIQPPVPKIAISQTGTASTDSSKPTNVAKSVTMRSSANPQGISKRQSAKTARGKAKKK